MAVTGADRWYLAVLVLGQGFHHFVIERDEEEIQALMEQEASFWEYVQEDREPPVDGTQATGDALEAVYSDSDGTNIALFGREAILREYQQLQEQQKGLMTQIETIKQTLMADLGESDSGTCGPYAVTWKPQVKRTFDAKRFIADHPDTNTEGYWKESKFRRFTIKEEK